MGIEKGHVQLHEIGGAKVITGSPEKKVAARRVNKKTKILRWPLVARLPYILNSRVIVSISTTYLFCLVGRAVIRDQNFVIHKGLSQQVIKRTPNRSCTVVNRHSDSYPRLDSYWQHELADAAQVGIGPVGYSLGYIPLVEWKIRLN